MSNHQDPLPPEYIEWLEMSEQKHITLDEIKQQLNEYDEQMVNLRNKEDQTELYKTKEIF